MALHDIIQIRCEYKELPGVNNNVEQMLRRIKTLERIAAAMIGATAGAIITYFILNFT